MRKHKPNPLRSLKPIFFGMAPLVGTLLWDNLIAELYAFIHQPPPMLSHPYYYGAVGIFAISLVWSMYLVWADFVRGDYYFDLMIHHDR